MGHGKLAGQTALQRLPVHKSRRYRAAQRRVCWSIVAETRSPYQENTVSLVCNAPTYGHAQGICVLVRRDKHRRSGVRLSLFQSLGSDTGSSRDLDRDVNTLYNCLSNRYRRSVPRVSCEKART